MTRDEALEIIREEQLEGYVWFEDPTNRMDIVAIEQEGEEWVVLTTNERAAAEGVRRFEDESAALENFIKRLRAGKRAQMLMLKRRRRDFS